MATTKKTGATGAEAAALPAAELERLTHRLIAAGEALRELVALLPEPTHRAAFEMALLGAKCSPTPVDVADTAAVLLRSAAHAKARRAPVLKLAGGAA
ncbi:MAG: hypothetical protein L6Q75_19620 [Burkholderiaceae bacterium]|nr:hypothetical protein [Burkholderiaceae bacterium]